MWYLPRSSCCDILVVIVALLKVLFSMLDEPLTGVLKSI